jgi:hypothetical protein
LQQRFDEANWENRGSFYKRYLRKMHEVGLKNLLYYSDIVSMKNSTENRSPFMDHRLVEFAFSHGIDLAVDLNGNKRVLRDYLEKHKLHKLVTQWKSGFTTTLSTEFINLMIEELCDSEILIVYTTPSKVKLPNLKRKLNKLNQRTLFRLYQVHLHHLLFFKTDLDE